jgi:glycosyltransferase involved in cell wall biosynthesis
MVSHSCVTTWFRAVRNADLPADWAWQRDLNARGLAAADIVIAPSRSHGEALEACYGTLPRLRIVHNAVRPIDCRRKLPLVLAAGRWWDEGKNAATLDRAAAGTRWPVLMAGATAGPNGERFEIANARPLGQLSRRRLAGWMARAAILASPSVYEPFGLVALEAASAGAALVLADIPTYRELWTDAAVFVPPRDASAWAEAIGRLASDDSHRAMLAARAWERASKLTVEAQAAATMTAYAEALFSPSHRRRAA